MTRLGGVIFALLVSGTLLIGAALGALWLARHAFPLPHWVTPVLILFGMIPALVVAFRKRREKPEPLTPKSRTLTGG